MLRHKILVTEQEEEDRSECQNFSYLFEWWVHEYLYYS